MFSSSSPIRVARSGNSKQLIRQREQRKVTASFQNMNPSMKTGTQMGSGAVMIGGVDITTPIIDPIAHPIMCDMFEDIYVHDAIAGAAIDLMSNLPFSDFTLKVPGNDDKIEEKFWENINRMRINTLLPSAAREYHVFGAHISVLIYKANEQLFTDTLPFAYKDCDITSNMLYGRDPVIRVRVPHEIRKFLSDGSLTAKSVMERMSPAILTLLRSGNFEIDPLSSIYFPRKTFSYDDRGVSIYKRILPIYLLEKVLMRGTLTMANRRQSSVVHVTAGSDEWEPTSAELQDLVSLVTQADRDPLGAVIATRNDVSISEIRQGGDFWRWNDIADELNAKKMTALGINESFLSGDITYSNMETALSVFMEQLRAFREHATNQFFYNKLFPLISITNDFTKSRFGVETAAASNKRFSNVIDYQMSDIDSLIMPEIEWKKKLMPEGDDQQMELMEKLSEKGVPFSLRAWAAAGGYDLQEVIGESRASIPIEQELAKLKKERSEQLKSDGDNEGESDAEDEFMSSLVNSITTGSTLKPIKLADREFPEEANEVFTRTATGKKQWVLNQHQKQRKYNEIAIGALQRIKKAQS